MTSRRSFIKSVAVGTAALSSRGILLAGNESHLHSELKEAHRLPDKPSGPWTSEFFPEKSVLSLFNGKAVIQGKLTVTTGGKEWVLATSRDGVSTRNCMIDESGDVQGYWMVISSGMNAELMFYHRSAQNFQADIRYEGEILFHEDAFACRTVPGKDEKVFNLASGDADSLLDDSLFSAENDCILQMASSSLTLSAAGEGKFSFIMEGKIDNAAEASFLFELKENYFKNRWVPYYKPLKKKGLHKVPTGWMSWNTYFDTATAEDNLAEARIGKEFLQPFGCEIWHIESWQGNSDHLPVSKFHNMNLEVNLGQFPEGMKALADDIRALGFKPGIWMAPFGTGNKEFYEEHKGWFLHGADGQPLSCWNGLYTLDPTVPEALEHIEKIFHTASFEWGYEYFKVDGMSGRNRGYCAHMYEREDVRSCFHNPGVTNPFENCVQAIRRGMGEDRYFLACQGHASGPEASYANASRLGADIVHPDKPVVWDGVLNQARCFLNQAFSHNIVMICDPDTLLVRDLDIEQARVSATIIALPGQLTFFGDKLKGLPEEKMKILQQTLPVTDVHPKSLYPYFSMTPVWNLAVKNGKTEPYNVIALFNWDEEKKEVSTSCEELGIQRDKYIGVEFWTGEPVSFASGECIRAIVPAHGVRILILHRDNGAPQWLGSDRHISSNAGEIGSYSWDSRSQSLEMDVKLVGKFSVREYIHVPEDYVVKGVSCHDAKLSREQKSGMLSLEIRNNRGGDVQIKIDFRHR